MEYLFWILITIGLILCAGYLFLIASFCVAWTCMRQEPQIPNHSVFVSVLVAVRDEAQTIEKCLQAIASQNYPHEKFELIVIDDHSFDATASIVQAFASKTNCITYLKLSEGAAGKKAAISYGIEKSKGELIVTTDGDCLMNVHWLEAVVAKYKHANAKMIVGPVAFHNENSLFEKMQSLEFMALIASGGGALFYKKAIMSNGANLAFKKEIFYEVGGYNSEKLIASGDDVLLMYKINEKYPASVVFLKDKEAIVYTKAKASLSAFVQQRKRWASKGFSVLNIETQLVSLVVYLMSAYLVIVPFLGGVCFSNTPFYQPFIGICLIILGIKCIIDFLLLFLSACFFQKKRLLILFIPEQIIYLLYVVLFGLIGSIGKYEWKGRKTN